METIALLFVQQKMSFREGKKVSFKHRDLLLKSRDNADNLQKNSVITKFLGPAKNIRYKRDCNITMMVITKFDCKLIKKKIKMVVRS
jgi:hypothetical protein